MKKISILLAGLLLMLAINFKSFGQYPGDNCGNAISMLPGNSCIYNNALPGTSICFSFVPDSSDVTVTIQNSPVVTQSHVHKFVVYDGNSTIVAIKSVESNNDTLLVLDVFDLTPGNIYYIQAERMSQLVCAKCSNVQDTAFFDLCVQNRTTLSLNSMLGSASSFGLLSGSSIFAADSVFVAGNAGAAGSMDTKITADNIFAGNTQTIVDALNDLNRAKSFLNQHQGTTLASQLGGQTLAAGVYEINTATNLNGTLTLTGDSNSVYVFNIAGDFTIEPLAIIALDGVSSKNIYWNLGNNLTLEDSAFVNGVFLADDSVMINSFAGGQFVLLAKDIIQINQRLSLLSFNELSLPEPISLLSSNCSLVACGPNLIVNGDFESGPSGISTYPIAGTSMNFTFAFNGNTNQYNVSNTGASPFTVDTDDHTATGNNYFFYGDAPSSNCCNSYTAIAWSQTVNVVNGQTYKFSAWFKNLAYYFSGADFSFLINTSPGFPPTITTIMGPEGVPQRNIWKQLCGSWTSNVTGSVTVMIICHGDASYIARDFGIDDIEFKSINLPAPIVTASSNFICAGQSVTLNASGGLSYSWSPATGLNTTTGATVIATPAVTTTYTVTAFGVGCSASTTVTIHVTPPPVPNFTIATEQCAGQTVGFIAANSGSGTGTITYSWNFGDPASGSNNVSTAQNPSHVYAAPGTYSVTLSITNNCGQTTAIVKTVNITPAVFCCANDFTYTFLEGAITSPAVATLFLNSFVNNEISIKGTLTIAQGQTLTIPNGKRVMFGPWGKLIIEPGARLVLDGATLMGVFNESTGCHVMWQGVEVWGNASKSHSTTNQAFQGKLTMINAARIRDAHNAVLLGKFNVNAPTPYVLSASGGILLASGGSTFLNNANNIRFAPYSYQNISKVENCSFSCIGTLLDPGYSNSNSYQYPGNNYNYAISNTLQRTSRYVHFWSVRDVTFKDNTFTNAEYGMESYNSRIKVIKGAGTGNVFSTMRTAIHINNYNSTLYGNIIEDCDFRNITGTFTMEIYGGRYDRVKNNKFNVTPPQINLSSHIALAMVDAISFNVLDNEFGKYYIGIACSNSFKGGGLIGYAAQGNKFTECNRSLFLLNNNQKLRVRCNEFNNPTPSLYTMNWDVPGTLANQGNFPVLTDKHPAGNEFDPQPSNPLNPRKDIFSANIPFTYYRHSFSATGNLSVEPVPLASVNNVLLPLHILNSGIQKTGTSCLPCNPPNCPKTTGIDSLKAEYQLVEDNLDQGQTLSLLAAVNGTTPAGQLKNMLLAASPLSDTVLTALINRQHFPLPAGMFAEVMLPNSPVSNEVVPSLQNRLNSMPNGIANQLTAAQITHTYRTLTAIAREIATLETEYRLQLNDLVSHYVDSDSASLAVARLELENTGEDDRTLLASYLEDGDLGFAAAKLNALTAADAEEQAFIDLKNMLLGLAVAGKTVFDMDTVQEQLVRGIANMADHGLAVINARAILRLVFGEEFPFQFPLQLNSLVQNPVITDALAPADYLGDNYPNPLDDITYIPYHLPETTTGIIKIYGIKGELLKSYPVTAGRNTVAVETGNWGNGIYVYSIEVDGAALQYKKMVLINKR